MESFHRGKNMNLLSYTVLKIRVIVKVNGN